MTDVMVDHSAVKSRENESAKTADEKNTGIHYMRGMAALIVLIHHASGYLLIYFNYDAIHKYIPLFGRYGVEIFFAISGYLMAGIIEKQQPGDFLLRRVVRIYPLAIIIILMMALQPWVPRTLNLAGMTMAPIGVRSANTLGVEWTLVLEIGFYVTLFLISLTGLARHLNTIASAWLIVLAYYAIFHREPPLGQSTITNFLLAPANIAFAIGLLLPSLNKLPMAPVIMLLFGLTIMALAHFTDLAYVRAVVAVSAALIVGWVASQHKSLGLLHRPLVKLGNDSYALYLCHVPIIILLYQHVLVGAQPLVLFVTGIITSLMVAGIIGYFDMYMHKRGRNALRLLPNGWKTPLAVSFAIVYIGLGIYFR